VRVSILVNHSVAFGDRLAVVGQDKVLGSWQPGDSLPLAWSEGDVWRAEVSLLPGVHEFKVGLRPGCALFCHDGSDGPDAASILHLSMPHQQQLHRASARNCSSCDICSNADGVLYCYWLQCVTIKSCGQLEWELGCNRVIEVRLQMGIDQYACNMPARKPIPCICCTALV
jgi:hypothetical protein